MNDDTPPLKSHGRLSMRASLQPRDLMADVVVRGAWVAQVITLLPEAFPGVLGASLTGRALDSGAVAAGYHRPARLWHRQTPQCR